ncbi:hypothetical protein M8998_08550 [Sphingobacterium sp. lm-10]|uniref:hypothetical protein n=1 Tax=Sphingobacterium sp. lm-10 TaxID=2944904 RepID=UPI00202087DE|nr:hypothetical protein [Sphingobacterium sp. lm-10]MCL7987986.1 hypothetical protein [Sphingobacterium sp. lm-10]
MFRLLAFLLSISRIAAQSFQTPALLGMGNTMAAHPGVYSAMGNPAGIAGIHTFSTGSAYQMHYLQSDLYTYGIYAVLPTFKLGALGLQFHQYNSANLLQQTVWQLNYAYPITRYWSAALGLQRHRVRWEVDTFPSAIRINIGVQYHRENLSIGGFVKQFSLANSENVLLPSSDFEMALGVNYLFSEQIYLATDIFWDGRERPDLRTGMEYRLLRNFRLRGGVSSFPLQYYLGLGLLRKKMHIDLAASIHRELGPSPQLGIAYVF